MSTFRYKARDQHAKPIEGVMAADSENAVALKLKEMGFIPVSIFSTELAPRVRDLPGNLWEKFQTNRSTDLNLFTRQLYALQKAGLPLLASLNAIKEQVTQPAFKNVIDQVIRNIEGGASLSAALEKFPKIFDHLYTAMIKAGEVSGRLVEVLERLTSLGEHDERLRLRIKAALRYPMIVVGGIIVGFVVLITFVIPRFANLYSQFKTALPLPTRMLVGIHDVVTHYWWAIVLGIGILIWVAGKILSTRKGLFFLDHWKLSLPVFGNLFLKILMSRFCRITGTLLHSGIPILQILDLVAENVSNSVVAQVTRDIKVSVNEGKGMLEPMRESRFFPPVVLQMVAVGEETGRLDELLAHVSDYYDSEVDYTLNNLVALIEPLLILVLGLAVLFLALGIFLPMWNMMNLFKK